MASITDRPHAQPNAAVAALSGAVFRRASRPAQQQAHGRPSSHQAFGPGRDIRRAPCKAAWTVPPAAAGQAAGALVAGGRPELRTKGAAPPCAAPVSRLWNPPHFLTGSAAMKRPYSSKIYEHDALAFNEVPRHEQQRINHIAKAKARVRGAEVVFDPKGHK
jgi:hypothetical protein